MFAPNPKLGDVGRDHQLGVGEALVSTLQEGGVPLPVERAMIVLPTSRHGALTDTERATVRSRSPVGGPYDTAIDRESAYEILVQRTGVDGGDALCLPAHPRQHHLHRRPIRAGARPSVTPCSARREDSA